MSLINKMLKDLDARGGQGHTPVTAEMHGVEESGERSRVVVAAIGVVAVSLAVGGVFGWRYYQKTAKQQPAQSKLAEGRVKQTAGPSAPPPGSPTVPQGTVAPAPVIPPQVPGVAADGRTLSGDAVAVQVPAPGTPAAAAARGAGRGKDRNEARGAPRRAEDIIAAQMAAAQASARGEGAAAPTNTGSGSFQAKQTPSNGAQKSGANAQVRADGASRSKAVRNSREREIARNKARAKAAASAAGAAVAVPSDPAADRIRASETAYRRALAQLTEGRVTDALEVLEQSLRLNPRHEGARQTIVGLYIEGKRGDDAMRHLQAALSLDPRQPDLAMLLARLQIERGGNGIDTLQRTLPAAAGQADYLAFLAGALERAGRHREAAEQYQAALRLKPQNGVWWMGLGVALQGDQRNDDAAEAFRRARASGSLSPELLAFVERRLQTLSR
jgi:MSHA biogenesis protein MshN